MLHHVQGQEGAVVGGDGPEDGEQHEREAAEESGHAAGRHELSRVGGLRPLTRSQVPDGRKSNQKDGDGLDGKRKQGLGELGWGHRRPGTHPDPAGAAAVSGTEGHSRGDARRQPAEEGHEEGAVRRVNRAESRCLHGRHTKRLLCCQPTGL